MDQAPLYVDNVADLTGIADVGPVVESLLLLGLVQAHSPRFSLTADLAEDRRRDLDSERWCDRVLESLPDWVERQKEPESVIREAPAILQALQHGVVRRAWSKVLRLGQTVESALILGQRWGAWEAVLRHQLQAARGLGDKAAEGWSLHQLGTRALCLGDTFTARAQLLEALRIRESLGDTDGAAVTRHNLELLSGPPPPKPPEEPPPKPPGGWRPPLLAGAAVIVVLVLGLTAAVLTSTTDSKRPITSVVDLMGGELSAQELDFGEQEVGTTSDVLRARLANTGDEPVVVDTVTLAGASPDDFVVSEDPCTGTSVAPGDACTVGIRFQPSIIGLRHATLVVSRGGSTLLVVLRGNGTGSALAVVPTTLNPDPDPGSVAAPAPGARQRQGSVRSGSEGGALVLVADPSELTFEERPIETASETMSTTMRNQGTAPVAVDQVALIGADGGDFIVDSEECVGRILSPGGDSCRMTVTFVPTAVGDRTATLQIASSNGGAPLLVALQGTGAPSADLSVELVKVGDNSSSGGTNYTLRVTNRGPSPVSDAILTIEGTANSSTSQASGVQCSPPGGLNCTVPSLGPGETATVTVTSCQRNVNEKVEVRVEADVFDGDESNNRDAQEPWSCAPG
ncbi:MAG TPA: choice-of-anchor D domain-containing protein [Acidimicrobiales bacterium]|nr:choice-of-anchor D domain-containing protein [Acidimicrobiales bacterium]